MKKIGIIISLIVGVTACNPSQNVDSPKLRREVENRKIRQIHEPEILEKALTIGSEVCSITEKILGKALKTKIQEKGIGEAISFCNTSASPLIQQVESKYHLSIKRVSLKNRNKANIPTELEAKLLDSYLYNWENKIESTENIHKNGDEYIYVKPIYVKELCLNCHGDLETNITPENHEKLKELYPNDLATGYKTGDLRGMWSIVLKKKDVVLAISENQWMNKKLRNPRTKSEEK